MSIRMEQYNALKRTQKFLRAISDPAFNMKAVKPVREEARRCLRHFPFLHEDGRPMFSSDPFLSESETRDAAICNAKFDPALLKPDSFESGEATTFRSAYPVIGICGLAGCGKTATAEAICKLIPNSVIIPFAKAVKQIARDSFGWNGEKDESGRKLLQRIGTDVGRSFDPNIWVNKWAAEVRQIRDVTADTLVIADDVRFQNEVDTIINMGGVVVLLSPTERGTKSEHASEQPQDLAVDCEVIPAPGETPARIGVDILIGLANLSKAEGK